MSTYPKEPRTEPDSGYEPDAPPDNEAAQEILDRVREAIYVASEDGSDQYAGRHPERYFALLRCGIAIMAPGQPRHPNHILDAAKAGDYQGAANLIEAVEGSHFGLCATATRLFHRDAVLAELKSWLRRRNRQDATEAAEQAQVQR